LRLKEANVTPLLRLARFQRRIGAPLHDASKQVDLIDQLGMMKPKIGAEAAVICTGYYYESDCRRSRRIPTRLVEL
jgi:hypothetical protein